MNSLTDDADKTSFERMCDIWLRSEPMPVLASSTRAHMIHNIVGSVNFSTTVDNTTMLKTGPSTYHPNFTSVVWRMNSPFSTILQFPNGFSVCTGTKSKDEFFYATHLHRLRLLSMGYSPKFRHASIDNVVISGQIDFPVKLYEYENNVCAATFDPYVFPALIMKIYTPECTALVFTSGSFMLVGLNEQRDIDIAAQHMFNVLRMHRSEDEIEYYDDNSKARTQEDRRDLANTKKRTLVFSELSLSPSTVAHSIDRDKVILSQKEKEEFHRQLTIKSIGIRGVANISRFNAELYKEFCEEIKRKASRRSSSAIHKNNRQKHTTLDTDCDTEGDDLSTADCENLITVEDDDDGILE